MTQVNVDTVIAAVIKLRDTRAELKKRYDTEDGVLKEKMEKLEGYLAQVMQDTNSTQLGSKHGTAYTQINMKASCSDWPSYWSFIQETGRFDMLEKRVGSTAIKDYYNETGDLPPGINISQEMKVVVRRS